MKRLSFLQATLVAAASMATPGMSPTPKGWDAWDKTPLPQGRPLELTMDLLDAGKERFRLSDYRGRAVLLNVFATWCGLCNQEQPRLVEAAKIFAPAGLSVIGMDCEDTDDSVRAYRKKYGITYPIAMDRRGGYTRGIETGQIGTADNFPVSVFFAPTGVLYGVRAGMFAPGELEYRVQKFLQDVSPTVATAPPSPAQSP